MNYISIGITQPFGRCRDFHGEFQIVIFAVAVPHGNNAVCRKSSEYFGAKPPKILESIKQVASRNESDNKGKKMLLGGEAPKNFK